MGVEQGAAGEELPQGDEAPKAQPASLRLRRRKASPAAPASQDRAEEEQEAEEAAGKGKPGRSRERVRAAGRRLQRCVLSLAQSVYRPLRRFFHDILHTRYRAATDVYALMFLADVVAFVIIIFGFWAFGVRGSWAARGPEPGTTAPGLGR